MRFSTQRHVHVIFHDGDLIGCCRGLLKGNFWGLNVKEANEIYLALAIETVYE